jgi:hypothetical protein
MRGDTATSANPADVQQRVEPAADQRVAARRALQVDEALDRLVCGSAVGVEVRRAVVALDDGDGAARLQQGLERLQRALGLGQVLQDEAHEDVVEGGGREG